MDSSSPDQSESFFFLGNCLSCQGLVRVPAKTPSSSVVRCPHCSESYRLSQILNQAVPELEIVEGSEPEEDTPRVDQIVIKKDDDLKDREVFVVPPQLSKGAKRSGRRRGSNSSSGKSTDGQETSGGSNGERSKRKSSSSSRSKRRSNFGSSSRGGKSKRSPQFELLKVVFGGLLAIPIAYLLVLWVFRQDPLNVGPSVGNVVPFLIPADLRGAEDDADDKPKAENNKDEKTSSNDGADSLAIPKLDPDRVLNPDQSESN